MNNSLTHLLKIDVLLLRTFFSLFFSLANIVQFQKALLAIDDERSIYMNLYDRIIFNNNYQFGCIA